MQPREKALDDGPGTQLEAPEPSDDGRVEKAQLSGAADAHGWTDQASRPLRGAGTASSRRVTIASASMRSDSA